MWVLTLPDLGEGLQQAEIVTWHVTAGDHVVTNQPLVAVETDKAVVDVPSPRAGTIGRLCAEPGDTVAVGAALVEFVEGESEDTGTVVGTLSTATEPAAVVSQAAQHGASPRVRALAKQLGVDLGGIEGSGPGGTILSRDVEAAAGTGQQAGEKLQGVRLAMARRMSAAHAVVVPASVHEDANVDAWPEGTDATVRLAMAIAFASSQEPALNARLDSDTLERELPDRVDLGVAVDTGEGLFVPTLGTVAQHSTESLQAELQRLVQAVTDRSIDPAELRGQTITLSNFGSIGGRYAELVVVPPQVAIVGAGRIRPEVRVCDGQATVQQVLPLSLTFDHRAVTGAEATRFLAAMITHLEQSQPPGGDAQ